MRDEGGEVAGEGGFGLVEVGEGGKLKREDEVFAEHELGVAEEVLLLFTSGGGEGVSPVFEVFEVTGVGVAHEGLEEVEEALVLEVKCGGEFRGGWRYGDRREVYTL